MEPLTLAIDGMSCGHCVGRVTRALVSLPGVRVEDVRVGSARLLIDPDHTDARAVVDAVVDAGYAARTQVPSPAPAER